MIEAPRSKNGKIELFGTSIIDRALETFANPSRKANERIAYAGFLLLVAGTTAVSADSPPLNNTTHPELERTELAKGTTLRFLAEVGIALTGAAVVGRSLALDVKMESREKRARRKIFTD